MPDRVRRYLGITLAGALAGCAGTAAPRLPLPSEPVVVAPPAGSAIPVARSYSEVLVRAFVKDAGGARREIGGAECLLETGAYRVRFESPGRVLVPVPRVNPPVLGVACAADGLEGIARRAAARAWTGPYFPPFARRHPFGPHGWWNDPFWQRRSGVWLGARFGDPIWDYGFRSRGAVVSGYPDVEVILR